MRPEQAEQLRLAPLWGAIAGTASDSAASGDRGPWTKKTWNGSRNKWRQEHPRRCTTALRGVAGGQEASGDCGRQCSPVHEKEMAGYGILLDKAFENFEGAPFSGGFPNCSRQSGWR
jgi:hypothetical protein